MKRHRKKVFDILGKVDKTLKLDAESSKRGGYERRPQKRPASKQLRYYYCGTPGHLQYRCFKKQRHERKCPVSSAPAVTSPTPRISNCCSYSHACVAVCCQCVVIKLNYALDVLVFRTFPLCLCDFRLILKHHPFPPGWEQQSAQASSFPSFALKEDYFCSK